MSESVYFNGAVISAADAKIHSASPSSLYGKGIFTTVALYDGKPLVWDKHWQRLTHNSTKIGLDLSEHTENSSLEALSEIIGKNRISNGRARITYFDERSTIIWPFESNKKTSLLITTGDLRPVANKFCLTISPYPVNSRSPLAGIKSCNYLENILAIDEAKNRGFNEAIRVNECGHITSGCMANIFWLSDGRLHTPSLTAGCLAGTTREYVLENIECAEVEAGIEVLDDAEAIFMTSAGLGVAQVAELQTRQLKRTDHPILNLLPRRR